MGGRRGRGREVRKEKDREVGAEYIFAYLDPA